MCIQTAVLNISKIELLSTLWTGDNAVLIRLSPLPLESLTFLLSGGGSTKANSRAADDREQGKWHPRVQEVWQEKGEIKKAHNSRLEERKGDCNPRDFSYS